MRSRFDEQLALLRRKLTEMGGACEEIIALAARALSEEDGTLAARVPPLATEIDQMERAIESLCLKLLLQQQPVARDLRQISAALKMITDMERIGDQASEIAGILPFLRGHGGEERLTIRRMAAATIKMVTDSVEAFVRQDVNLAQSVIAYDDVVDEDFTGIKNALIGLLTRRAAEGEYAIDLLMVAKYFERIGDHATNIARWVVFSVTGVHEEE